MELTSKQLKEIADKLPSPSSVAEGYLYWVDELTRRIINIFTYDNLPDTCNETALRRQLIDGTLHNGCSIFVKDNGDLYNVDGSPYGVTPYSMYKIYDKFTIANPVIRVREGIEGVDGVIVWNDSMHKGLTEIINRYARMLADEDSTFSKVLYNMRRPNIFNAPDEKVAKSIKAALDANELGIDKIVLGKDILSEASILANAPGSYGNGVLTEHIQTKTGILNQFMRELGIPCVDEKKERINEMEIVNQNAGLSIIHDMLNTQTECFEKVNALFDTNIIVRVSDEWSWILEEPKMEEEAEPDGMDSTDTMDEAMDDISDTGNNTDVPVEDTAEETAEETEETVEDTEETEEPIEEDAEPVEEIVEEVAEAIEEIVEEVAEAITTEPVEEDETDGEN